MKRVHQISIVTFTVCLVLYSGNLMKNFDRLNTWNVFLGCDLKYIFNSCSLPCRSIFYFHFALFDIFLETKIVEIRKAIVQMKNWISRVRFTIRLNLRYFRCAEVTFCQLEMEDFCLFCAYTYILRWVFKLKTNLFMIQNFWD